MTKNRVLLATLLLGGLTLTAGAQVAQRPDSQAAAQAEPSAASAEVQRRVAKLKADMPRKLSRKPKHERDAIVAQWQTARGAIDAPAPFDQPQSAQTFFLEKRLPAGQTALSPQMYRAALDQAARMPVYSTLERRMVAAANGSPLTKPSVVTRSKDAFAPAASGTTAVASGLAGAWEPLGPGNIGGRTRALVIHPTTPDTMWAGAVAGGIWKTTNGGASWTPKADLLINIAVNSMALDPRNSNTLYAGTGEGYFNGDAVRGAGILKSTDGGETWTQLPATTTPDFHYVQKIVVSAGAAQRIYAATRTGVFRSTDGGNSWTKVLNGTAVNGCMDLAIQTDRALAMVFAACGSFTQAAIHRALDTGGTQTWTSVFSPPSMGRTSLAIAPSNQNYVYAMAASNEAGTFNNGLLGVYRSTASGASGSWSARVTNTSPTTLNRLLLSNPVYGALAQCGYGPSSQFYNQGWYDNVIAVDPVDPNIVWAGGIDLFRSDDGGQNWGQASHWWFTRGVDPEYAHADNHALVFHPGYNGTTNKIMFNGSDGGLFKTADARAPVAFSPDPITPASPVCGNTTPGGVSWTELNNGYQVTQFYHGQHYPNGDTFFGGTQDNGTIRGVTGSPNAWAAIAGGDGGYVAVNPANTNMLWTEFTGLSIQRSLNGGGSYSSFTSGVTEGGGNFLFITPFAQDPSNPSLMWIGGARPWRTAKATDNPIVGNVWTQASSTFFGSRTTAIGISPLDSNRVYFGVGSGGGAVNGTVFTTNVGTTSTSATAWTSSKPRADSNVISWIAPDPVVAGRVYATVSTFNSGANVGHVFRSNDFGATWTNIDGSGATGIPDVPVHSLLVDPNNNNILYVGTDIGVFVSLDAGANWARENTGFANVIVESLSLKNTAPRYLYAYTHGRSAYRVALP